MELNKKYDNIHLLFEQSGTFKNEFKKLGFNAYDYDIVNTDYVDYQLDLFNEIKKAYSHELSIFDNINTNDLVIAFFPCIRFSNLFQMCITCNQSGLSKLCDKDKLLYAMDKHDEINYYYKLLIKLMLIAYERNFKLIVENPIGPLHYLKLYFPIKPAVVIDDRRDFGDYFKKPTQFYFINCKPSYNFIFDPLDVKPKKLIKLTKRGIDRSIISNDFVNRFIREFIL